MKPDSSLLDIDQEIKKYVIDQRDATFGRPWFLVVTNIKQYCWTWTSTELYETMPNNIVDDQKQCCPHNIVVPCFEQFLNFWLCKLGVFTIIHCGHIIFSTFRSPVILPVYCNMRSYRYPVCHTLLQSPKTKRCVGRPRFCHTHFRGKPHVNNPVQDLVRCEAARD